MLELVLSKFLGALISAVLVMAFVQMILVRGRRAEQRANKIHIIDADSLPFEISPQCRSMMIELQERLKKEMDFQESKVYSDKH